MQKLKVKGAQALQLDLQDIAMVDPGWGHLEQMSSHPSSSYIPTGTYLGSNFLISYFIIASLQSNYPSLY